MDKIVLTPKVAERHCNRGLSPAYVDSEYVLTIVLDGSGVMLLDGVRYELKIGDVILVEPRLRHILNVSTHERMLQYVVHFTLDHGMLPSTASNAVIATTTLQFKQFRESCVKLEFELQQRNRFYELRAESILLEMLALYLSNREAISIGTEVNLRLRPNLERAITFIHANFRRSLPVAEIARSATLSPNYFCRVFHEATSTTVHQYLNTVRIEEAKRLIRIGEMNFSQIATTVGFPSIHLFSRLFRRIEQETPSQYAAQFRRT